MKKFLTLVAFFGTLSLTTQSSVFGGELRTVSEASILGKNYVQLKHLSTDMLCPWLIDEAQLSVMMPCPDNITINLSPGKCGAVVPNFGFSFPAIIQPAFPPVTQNGFAFSVNSTTYCSTGQTKYSRIFTHNGPTGFLISSINLGVYQSFNFPLVKVNIYASPSNILLGSHFTPIPNITQGFHSFIFPSPITVPAGTSYRVEIVSNAPEISVFKMGRNTSGHLPGFTDAVISSSCLPQNLTVEGIVGLPGDGSIVFSVVGQPADYKFTNTNPLTAQYKEGDFFPIGVYNMMYVVTDYSGNASTPCPFSITINEFNNPTGAMACNDEVQVSLDDKCELIITPDMLLKGNNYGCYDKFTVQIIGNNGAILGNKVTKLHIGQKLKTQIISPTGNSCWGDILVQDKSGPMLSCDTLYATCATDLTPGSLLSTVVPVAAKIIDGDLTNGGPNSNTFLIPVGNIKGSTITDLNVFLDISHDRISDLAANITSPDGVTVPLFIQQLACNGANMVATFDDESPLLINCEPTTVPSISGKIKPFNSLSIFDGKPMGGLWRVTVYDLANGIGGTVNNIHLVFGQSGGKIAFPTPKDVSFAYDSPNTYVVNGIDACTSATLSYVDQVIQENCQDIYSKVIRRCWTGYDTRGNLANSCCQLIYVYRHSLSNINFPPNFDGLFDNPDPLSCSDYGDSIPPVSITGMPQGDFCDNVEILEPTDVTISICKRSYKLLRTHKVIDWCNGSVIVHNQVIKVLDETGPVMECPQDVTISTNDYSCNATYKVPKPKIIEDCSDTMKYFLEYLPAGVKNEVLISTGINQSLNTISELPLGKNLVRWIVTDECGNTSRCSFNVTIIDYVRPIAVCDIYTVASITGDGKAKVFAYTFDDGSSDNCGILKFEARKMTDSCGFGTTNFTPFVEFCCEEVNTSVMVEMRVTDVHGNSNTCMVEVRVQDKLPPYITSCPPDITLNCQADYKDLNITKRPLYTDNCVVDSVWYKDVDSISQCGTGIVTRTWTVRDKQNLRHSCVQIIRLIDNDPFYVNIENPNDPFDDIVWPKNYETKKCKSKLSPTDLPDGFNKPTWNDDNCNLVATHYKDQVFKFSDGACEKILRTWTVIDWCTYNEKSPVYGKGWYEYIQIIKLLNDIPPTFEFACVDRTVPSYGICKDSVDFTMTAIDDCPEDNVDLVWKYELFTENGLIAIDTGYTNRFRKVLNNGKYRVKWTVEDKCGNRAFCTHKLDVIEYKKPTPYCITSLTTAVMNSNGTVEIWARDYDIGGFDNCTPKDSLWFTFFEAKPVDTLKYKQHYFKGNGILASKSEYEAGNAQIWKPTTRSSGLFFDCADIPNGKSQQVSLNVTLTDLASNQDYCTIILVLQDNANVCPDSTVNMVALSGTVGTPSTGKGGTTVMIESNFKELNKTLKTDGTGNYSFSNLPTNYDYTISVQDNKEVMNGVSTLDMVMIQRHILGFEVLTDPKKIIASDIDNNGKITAADLLALRKNILGISTDFPNGQQSWRFVPINYSFLDVSNPFPFIEKYSYNKLIDNKNNQSFTAIKIGDINNSATINAHEPNVELRTTKILALETEWNRNQEIVTLPIYATDFENISGYQFTIKFDYSNLSLDGIAAGELPVNEQNFGLHKLDNGIITTSWHTSTPIQVDVRKPLFSLKFKLKNEVIEPKYVTLSSEITASEAYDISLRKMDIKLTNRTRENNTFTYELRQNVPNPFNDNTNISFVLPEKANAKLTFSDISGKVLKTIAGEFNKGENILTLSKQDVGVSGMIIYKIESGSYTDTKKMIIIE